MKYTRNPAVLFVKENEETALYHVNKDEYFTLNEVATFVWGLLEAECSEETIVNQVMLEFSVERAECEQDIRELLASLISEDILLEV